MEFDLCEPCYDALKVLQQAAALFGETLTAAALSALCPTCAEAGLEAMGNGPGT